MNHKMEFDDRFKKAVRAAAEEFILSYFDGQEPQPSPEEAGRMGEGFVGGFIEGAVYWYTSIIALRAYIEDQVVYVEQQVLNDSKAKLMRFGTTTAYNHVLNAIEELIRPSYELKMEGDSGEEVEEEEEQVEAIKHGPRCKCPICFGERYGRKMLRPHPTKTGETG